ncbi:unnamed protein product [Schistosoma turkestanicum]|nr:unnamed protein product [Schistosoma turkestanicum]
MLFSIYVTNRTTHHPKEIVFEEPTKELYNFGINIIVLKNVSLDPSKIVGAIGGEDPMQVANQPESHELLNFQHGFIKRNIETNIKENRSIQFNNNNDNSNNNSNNNNNNNNSNNN